MWGGSGAVWELNIDGIDKHKFRAAIIELATQMDAEELGTERSRFISNVFKNWEKRGI
jgi:hypothetical protein